MKFASSRSSQRKLECGSVKAETAIIIVFLALIGVPSLSYLGGATAEKLCEPVPNTLLRGDPAPQDNRVEYYHQNHDCGQRNVNPNSVSSVGVGNGGSWTAGGVGGIGGFGF